VCYKKKCINSIWGFYISIPISFITLAEPYQMVSR